MNSNYGDSSDKYGTSSGKKGSVLPKEREHVSTMMGKTIAEVGSKAAKLTFNAFKNQIKNGKK
ncbi:hypothetical protein F511_05024 [Dorcoceras hygrometricum]|uniref:Uncharacterized protein n=1 Tax=Dorcoceras hygrometricum TaxID=472368 RepID=A0A2Z7AN25_9LAMI|nr:hypothetical protein F511_05024 [Dorcoceras hygrometricum]